MQDVIVVGGGVSGLATAYFLQTKAAREGNPCAVTVLEASARWGGNLRTEEHEGFLLDTGPDSWVASKPAAETLAQQLGLGEELISPEPAGRHVYLARQGRLYPFPEGAVMGIPTRVGPLATSKLFSWRGKLRMALEPWIPARHWGDEDDESIESFVTRRLGHEAAERLTGPLLSGILSGEASRLSLRATFPFLLEAEKRHGSLVKAMRAQAKQKAHRGPPPSPFLSLRRGMGSLVEALRGHLPSVTLRTGASVQAVTHAPGDRFPYRVHLAHGDTLAARAVVLALPAFAASPLLQGINPELADLLASFRFAGVATVFFAFRRRDVLHPLDGAGFLVPRTEAQSVLATTWVSSKWVGRAPAGTVLLRAFVGGAGKEACLAHDDPTLTAQAYAELSPFLGLRAPPLFTRVYRFARGSCQPELGHLQQLAHIRARLKAWPGLALLGSGLDTLGLSDCIRKAEETAAALLAP